MPPDPAAIRRMLVIQFRPWGDVLLATSYLEALSRRFPNAALDFLVSAPYDDVLAGNPYVRQVLVSPRRGGFSYYWGRLLVILRVMRRRYDIIVDQASGPGSGIVLLFSGARYRVGWENGRSRRQFNLKATVNGRPRYAAARNFDMVRPLGIEETPFSLHYRVRADSHRYVDDWLRSAGLGNASIVTFSPGAHEARKQWDARRFAALADLIGNDTGHAIVIVWGPGEEGAAREMAGAMRRVSFMAPPTSFNQAAALLCRSVLLVCNDGGLNHLSVATGTPALALFGPTTPGHWSPQGTFPLHRHVWLRDGWKRFGNTFGVSAEDAFTVARRLLADIEASAHPAPSGSVRPYRSVAHPVAGLR